MLVIVVDISNLFKLAHEEAKSRSTKYDSAWSELELTRCAVATLVPITHQYDTYCSEMKKQANEIINTPEVYFEFLYLSGLISDILHRYFDFNEIDGFDCTIRQRKTSIVIRGNDSWYRKRKSDGVV